MQSNPFNESRISTVVVAVITSNLALANAPGNLRLSRTESGLPKASVVNVSQLITIDRSLLTLRVKSFPAPLIQELSVGLRLVLGL